MRFRGFLISGKKGLNWRWIFRGLLRSALMGKASKAAVLLGMSDAREGARVLQDRTVYVNPDAHAVDRLLEVLPELGIRKPSKPEFSLPETEPLLDWDKAGPFVAIHPFARGKGKSLSESVLRAICEGCPDVRLMLVGRGELCASIDGVEDLLNRTSLPELVWLLRRASAVVSVDSGPAHIAAAVNPDVLSIHTWSDPAKVGPYGADARVWKGGEIAPVSQLSAAARQQTRNVQLSDVPEICHWIRSRGKTKERSAIL